MASAAESKHSACHDLCVAPLNAFYMRGVWTPEGGFIMEPGDPLSDLLSWEPQLIFISLNCRSPLTLHKQ